MVILKGEHVEHIRIKIDKRTQENNVIVTWTMGFVFA